MKKIQSLIIILIALLITFFAGKTFYQFSHYETYFYVGENVKIEKMSDYSPRLKNTVGDANIYVIDSGVPGASLLILGGTHPNEPSGQLTATLFLENLNVTKGKVYIITETNKSAYTHTQPLEGSPMYYTITTASGGERTFKYGSRATNTNQQWPNPDVYEHNPSGQKLSSTDVRNLNRSYPGSENGTYTERVAWAVTNCIKQNDITMTIDLHEASPEYLTINAIIAHEGKAYEIANSAKLEMDFEYGDAFPISVEVSPENLHGLTHRELGVYTNTLAFLCETSNASQGKIRGAFNSDLITTGEDKFYEKADKEGLLYAAPCDISERVARHTFTIMSIIAAYNNENLDNMLEISNIPTYQEILDNKIGFYLKDK